MRATIQTVCFVALLGGCGSPLERAPEPPRPVVRRKGVDGPEDPARRARFLAGTSSAEAPSFVASNNPAHLDAVAAFFSNPQKPYAERLAALRALRALREQDTEEYARVFARLKPRLWEEASHGDGLSMSEANEKGFVEAIGWFADLKDSGARLKMELHLDRETVRRKRLSDAALIAVALGLAAYPDSESARDTLWAALKDPKEKPPVRAAALKALQAFHPLDLESKVLDVAVVPGDEWMRDLQRKLR